MALDTTVRTQAVFPSTTGRPEDTCTNTFHHLVDGSADRATTCAEIHSRISDFYITGGTSVSAYMSSTLSRAANTAYMKSYYLEDDVPRVPALSQFIVLDTPTTANQLPAQLAAVITYQGTPVSGEPQARKRGRIYVGPLASNALTGSDGTLASAFVTVLRTAAGALASEADTVAAWIVYSRTANTASVVTDGWVDNKTDTQRRRGQIASARTTWT